MRKSLKRACLSCCVLLITAAAGIFAYKKFFE